MQEDAIKEGILVVGRMGHGKSAFIRMLADQSQKQRIKVKASNKTVTKQAQIYRCKPDIFPNYKTDNVYLVDTPGLDSKQNIIKSVHSFEHILVEKNIEIIGIAYIICLNMGRQITLKGESYLKICCDLLKIRYKKKSKLFFTVFTQWDKIYKYKQKAQKLLKEYEQTAINANNFSCDQIVKWASQPEKEANSFSKYQESEEGKLLYDHQFKKLGEILIKTSAQRQSISRFKFELQKFEHQIIKLFRMCITDNSQVINLKKSTNHNEVDIQFNQKKVKSNIQKSKNRSGKAFQTFTCQKDLYQQLKINYSLQKFEIKLQFRSSRQKTEGYDFFMNSVFIALMSIPFHAAQYFFQTNKQSYKIIEQAKDQKTHELDKIVFEILKKIAKQLFLDNIKLQNNLYIKYREIDKKIFNVQIIDSSNKIKKISDNKNIEIPNNKQLRFRFQCYLPQRKVILSVIEKYTRIFYGPKEEFLEQKQQ